MVDLYTMLRCPRCRSAIERDPVRCSNPSCGYAAGFPEQRGQPVLIDFETSIIGPQTFESGPGTVLPRFERGSAIGRFLYRLTYGTNEAAARQTAEMVKQLRRVADAPLVLVIGGGTIGSGARPLYEAPGVTVIGTDIYASDHTALVSDGHRLPFADGSFDGVMIQAVLEHVLQPQQVVDEIHRVLKPGGIVYADTPLLQQVHEAGYDFTRFTFSGHRWLFRRFDEIQAGMAGGPGIALLWSISYFVRALGGSPALAALIAAPFFWVRLLDRFARRRAGLDAASAVFFLGARSERELHPRDMPAYYDSIGQERGPAPPVSPAQGTPELPRSQPQASPTEGNGRHPRPG